MRRTCLQMIAILAPLLLAASLARAQTTTPPAYHLTSSTQPADAGPIRYETFVRVDPPLRGYIARVDLTDPRVQITAATGGTDPDGDGPWETILTPTSDIARASNFDLAVNGTFFAHQMDDPTIKSYAAGAPARPAQPVMIDGKFVSAVHNGDVIVFDKDNHAFICSIKASIPADARTIVGGSGQIVFRGRNTGGDEKPAPRTAVGLTDDGKTLVILVVDGRRPEFSAGLMPAGLADEMIRLGCTSALNFDGGGSSTMVRKFGAKDFRVINTPSDGSQLAPLPLSIERPVANVLGIRIVEPPSPATPAPATSPADVISAK